MEIKEVKAELALTSFFNYLDIVFLRYSETNSIELPSSLTVPM